MSYHAKNGKFSSKSLAHSVTMGGERYKVVRSYRRIKGGRGEKVSQHQRKTVSHEKVVEAIERAKARMSLARRVMNGSGYISISEIAEWGNDTGVKATFSLKGGSGKPKERTAGRGRTPPETKSKGEKTVSRGKKLKPGEKMVFGKVVKVEEIVTERRRVERHSVKQATGPGTTIGGMTLREINTLYTVLIVDAKRLIDNAGISASRNYKSVVNSFYDELSYRNLSMDALNTMKKMAKADSSTPSGDAVLKALEMAIRDKR